MHQRSKKNLSLFSKLSGAVFCAPGGAFAWLGCLLIGLALTFTLSCVTRPDWYFGVGGNYNRAETEILRGRAADLDKAIVSLQAVVQEDPTYRNSLTLLGEAYYRKKKYAEAYAIIQRALAVNKDDEIAWLIFGLAQVRLGEHAKGIETIKGGLTLLAKAMGRDYRDYPNWDPRGRVHGALNRAVFQALKGSDGRENLVRSTELLLDRINEEEWYQRRGQITDRVESGSDN